MTKEQRRIVCATDFSAGATAALRWAAGLAVGAGDGIDLVTVVAPPATSFPELMMDAAVLDTVLLQAARERLSQLAEQMRSELGLDIAPHVLHGEPHRAIMAHADSVNARLVVLGAHGGSAVGRWLLGSVAERTVRMAARPVAIVPPAGKLGASVEGAGQPLRVLIGLEAGAAGPGTLELARALRRIRPCDVTVLYLYSPAAEYQRLGLEGSRDLLEPDPDVIRNIEPALRRRVGALPGEGTVEISIRPAWGDPAANLLVAADEGNYQLLIVGAEQRHGLARLSHPSVAQRLVGRAAEIPVIYVPAGASLPVVPSPETVPRFSTVLSPTDLSPEGNAAIAHAYALLASHGGVVELCHIHRHALPNPPFEDQQRGLLSPEAVAELQRRLRALVPPFAQCLGVRTHVSVIEGTAPAEAIVQAAERLGVDAITLGSHGRGAVAQTFLGSVAQEVVQSSRKPVLVVPSPRPPAGLS